MKSTITKNEYYQLIGLLKLGQSYNAKCLDIEKAMSEIVGEKEKFGGHCGDAIYSNYSVDELLDKLNLKVSGPQKLHN
jgi:hypothetical protein